MLPPMNTISPRPAENQTYIEDAERVVRSAKKIKARRLVIGASVVFLIALIGVLAWAIANYTEP